MARGHPVGYPVPHVNRKCWNSDWNRPEEREQPQRLSYVLGGSLITL